MDEFARTMMVLLAGLGVATLLGIVGVAGALARGVRVFVIPPLHRLAGGDFSAIGEVAAARPRFNHAIFILASSLFVPILACGGILAAWGATGANANAPKTLSAAIGLGVVMLGPLAAIPVYLVLSQRIVAATPSECWPEQFAAALPSTA
jgi:hypothetical protein